MVVENQNRFYHFEICVLVEDKRSYHNIYEPRRGKSEIMAKMTVPRLLPFCRLLLCAHQGPTKKLEVLTIKTFE